MESLADKPSHRGWAATLIALLASLALLLLAGWLDSVLEFQQKLASASFEYSQLFWVQVGARSLLVATWFGLAWLVLVKLPVSRVGGLIMLALGLFVLLGTYLGLLAGLPLIRSHLIYLLTEFVSLSGAFIAVLGLLVVTKRAPL